MVFQHGEEAMIWLQDWTKRYTYYYVSLHLMDYVTFQVLEGKSRKGQRISLSIQFNPMDKKWELFDESSTEARNDAS